MVVTPQMIMFGVSLLADAYARLQKLGAENGIKVPTIEEAQAKNQELQDAIDAELKRRGIDTG